MIRITQVQLTLRICLFVGVISLLITAPLLAAPVTFTYQGTVNSTVGGFGGFSGDTFTAEFTFESTTADGNPGNPNIGDYSSAITGGTVTVDTDSITLTGGDITVEDDLSGGPPPPDDEYLVVSSSFGAGDFGGFVPDFFVLLFHDDDGTPLSSDALPTSEPDPAAFDAQTTLTLDFSASMGELAFMTASGNISIVPEPGSLAILLSLVPCAGVFRRRLRKAVAR